MDEFSVKDSKSAARAASDERGRDRLREMAEEGAEDHAPPGALSPDGTIAVAGRSLDLSGLRSCAAAACRIEQVDTLINEVWHYFDKVVVEGPSARLFLARGATFDYHAEQAVAVLLYLRDIGALPYLIFRDKPHAFCTHHFAESARAGGVDFLLDKKLERRVEREIARTATLEELPKGRGYSFTYAGSSLALVIENAPGHEDASAPTIEDLARVEYRSVAMSLLGDITLAREMSATLVQGAEDYQPVAPTPEQRPTEAAVALELPLPVLHGLPAKELLKLRDDYRPELERFRAALRLAIREAAARDPEAPAGEIAGRVVAEYVRPQLADIELRLSAAKRTLAKKSAVQLGVGTAITTVGLLAAAPIVIGAGITALGTTLLHGTTFIDKTTELELSDMHFLWRAQRIH